MKRLVEIAGIVGVLVTVLVLLFGDNWLGWHPGQRTDQQAPGAPALAPMASEPVVPKTAEPAPPRLAPVVQTIVIHPVSEQPVKSPALSVPPSSDTPDTFSTMLRRIKRSTIETRATSQCRLEIAKLSGGLSGLIFRASIAQNQFYNTSSSKAMIADLAKWLPDAKDFLAQHKTEMPDTSVFDLANPTGSFGTFHRDGTKAWAIMDAKRKALESISHQLEAKPCDKIGKAAVAECDETSNCQAPD